MPTRRKPAVETYHYKGRTFRIYHSPVFRGGQSWESYVVAGYENGQRKR